jgi:type I restriction enzyme S subunit
MNISSLPISEFCKTGSGTTPSRSRKDYYFGGDIPWVKSGELREVIITNTEETVTEEALAETPLKIAPKGSILVAMYGANVGRLGILGIDATTNQAVCHLVPDPEQADTKYVFHALRQKLPEFLSRSVGGAQPNISQQIIRATKVLLPSIAEQKRIAAILDKAEELRELRRQALRELDALAQSIFIEMFGDPTTHPKRWDIRKVSDYVSCFQGGKSVDPEDENTVTRNRIVKVSAVTSMIFRPEESKPLPDEYDPPLEYFVKPGDLLFSRANTSDLVGAVAFVESTPPNIVLADKIWRFVWKEPVLIHPLFIWTLFQTPTLRYEISRRATGTSGSMKNISQAKTLGIQTILPPLPLQQEFAHRIEAIEQLKTTHRGSLAQLDALFASLQHRAFRGEL